MDEDKTHQQKMIADHITTADCIYLELIQNDPDWPMEAAVLIETLDFVYDVPIDKATKWLINLGVENFMYRYVLSVSEKMAYDCREEL